MINVPDPQVDDRLCRLARLPSQSRTRRGRASWSRRLDLAEEHHAAFRKVVKSDWYRAAFPTMSPAADKDTALVFRTSRGGQRKAFSVESRITGQGADIIILDDPLDASDAQSELACAKVNDWIVDVLMGRFNKGATGVMVLVMQRLAVNDPSARLQEIEDWTLLSFRQLPRRPSRSRSALAQSTCSPRATSFIPGCWTGSTSTNAAGRWGMRPTAPSTSSVRCPRRRGDRHQSLPAVQDAAHDKGHALSQYRCRLGLGLRLILGDPILADQRWPHLSGAQPERSLALSRNCENGHWMRRSRSRQTSSSSNLHRTGEPSPRSFGITTRARKGHASLQIFKPQHAKSVRMDLAMVPIEASRVFLPEQADWLAAFLAELQAFPNGANDDQVDALSQAIWFFGHRSQVSRHNPAYRSRSRVISPRCL